MSGVMSALNKNKEKSKCVVSKGSVYMLRDVYLILARVVAWRNIPGMFNI